VNVAVINVPAILTIFGSSAGKLGHAGIEARAGELGKHARRLSLIVLEPLAHIRGMDTTVDRVLNYMMLGITAVTTALSLAYIAHYDFGLSRQEIRTPAVVGATVIGLVVAVEFFRKKLAKPN
jgi:hypothetical protein